MFPKNITKVQFDIWSSESIKNKSVLKIENNEDIESKFLGPSKGETCITCYASYDICPGHFGHIELEYPIFNIFFFKHLVRILQTICLHCLRITKKNDKFCKKCTAAIPKITNLKCALAIKINYDDKQRIKSKIIPFSSRTHLIPTDVLSIISRIESQSTILSNDNSEIYLRDLSPGDRIKMTNIPINVKNMIIDVLPVLPITARPNIDIGTSTGIRSKLTVGYREILTCNKKLQNARKNNEPFHIIANKINNLQFHVQRIMDESTAEKTKKIVQLDENKYTELPKTFRERICSKEGRIRKNIMGKRVNFTARTVATGDAMLNVDQIGIPPSIATSLTFPENVNRYNKKILIDLIENGKTNFIIKENGEQIDLNCRITRPTYQIDIGDIVERQMRDDDLIVVNRQPSLHRGSMFALKVKILPGSTIRMNLSNTTPLNLDFDGDELNLHFPQSYLAVAELSELLMIQHLAVNPQNESPMFALVQDSLLGIYKMTRKDAFLTKDQYMQLMMYCDEEYPEISIPSIMVPNKKKLGEYTGYWSGKQIVTQILPETFKYKCGDVLIQNGELLDGCLTKQHVGTSYHSIITYLTRYYSADRMIIFLNEIQKIITQYLHFVGFSIGIGDCFINEKVNKKKIKVLTNLPKELPKLEKAFKYPESITTKMIKEHWSYDKFEMKSQIHLTKVRDEVSRSIVDNVDDSNAFMQMANAGSKGSLLNVTQVTGMVGQQQIYGGRVEDEFEDRCFPHFKKYDRQPIACGFISRSYLDGLSPIEFFNHAKSGRIGILGTTITTKESGYFGKYLYIMYIY
jgi:DNA-directed RNA polymerase II subunit RPB1